MSSRGRIVKPIKRNEHTLITKTTTDTSQQQQDGARWTRRRSRVAKVAAGNVSKKSENVSKEQAGSRNQRKTYPLRRQSGTGRRVGRPTGSYKRGRKVKNTASSETDGSNIIKETTCDVIINKSADEQRRPDTRTLATEKSENNNEHFGVSARSVITVTAEISQDCVTYERKSQKVKVPSINKQEKIIRRKDVDVCSQADDNRQPGDGDHKTEFDFSRRGEIGAAFSETSHQGVAKSDCSSDNNKVSINVGVKASVLIKQEVGDTVVHEGVGQVEKSDRTETKSEFSPDTLTSCDTDRMELVGKEEDSETGKSSQDKAEHQSSGGAKQDLNANATERVKNQMDGEESGQRSKGSPASLMIGSPASSVSHLTGRPGQEQKTDVVTMAATSEITNSPRNSAATTTCTTTNNTAGSTTSQSPKTNSSSHSLSYTPSSTAKAVTSVSAENHGADEYIRYKCPKKKFLEAMKIHNTTTTNTIGGLLTGSKRTSADVGPNEAITPDRGGKQPCSPGDRSTESQDFTDFRFSAGGDAVRNTNQSTTQYNASKERPNSNNDNMQTHVGTAKAPFNLRTCIDKIMESNVIRECLRNTGDREGRDTSLQVLNDRRMDPPPPQQKVFNNVCSAEIRARSNSATLQTDMRQRARGATEGFLPQEMRHRNGSGTLPADRRPRAGTWPAGIPACVRVTQGQTATPPLVSGGEMRVSPVEMHQRSGALCYPPGIPPHTNEQLSPHYRHGG